MRSNPLACGGVATLLLAALLLSACGDRGATAGGRQTPTISPSPSPIVPLPTATPPSSPAPSPSPTPAPSASPAAPVLQRGHLLLGPASGVEYRSASREGLTGPRGEFDYLPGETLHFSLGGMALGSATGAAALRARDLAGDDGSLALLRWLISLDEDADAGNGLQFSAARRSALAALIDATPVFSDPDFFSSELAAAARQLSGREVADELAALSLEACQESRAAELIQGGLCPLPARDAVAPLRVSGRDFIDQQDRAVLLQGLFAVWKLDGFPLPPDDPNVSFGFTREDASLFARLGFNSVRFAWFWNGIEPRRDEYDETYLARLEEITRWFGEEGVFVIHDAHQDGYGERYGQNGMPDWATIDDGLPFNDQGVPANYFLPPVSYAFDNFWLNRAGVQDEFVAMWQMIAERFRDDPMTLGYDLFNEPWPGTGWASCANQSGCPLFDLAVLQPAQDAWAAAIREVDTQKVIFYEPHLLFGQGAGSWLDAPPEGIAPVALSYHALCLARATNQTGLPDEVTDLSQAACPLTDQLIVSNAEAVAARLGGPAVMTELQAANHEDFAKLECIIEAAERRAHGWTNGLSWKSGGELRRMNPDQPDLVGRMKVLSRPYPRALNGTVLRHGFDPRTRVYELEFTPGQASAAHSSLFVPVEVHYPHGYVASVEGGRVVSNPGASRLQLLADEGAAQVHLRLEPPPDDPLPGLDIPSCEPPPLDPSGPLTGGDL